MAEIARTASSLREIAEAAPAAFIRYGRGIREYRQVIQPESHRGQPCIFYIYGPPGTGKSYWAHTKYPDAFWAADSDKGYMCGYDAQDVIVFDDFEGKYPFGMMKRLVDRYKLRSEVKGGSATIRATTFVFTSNLSPADVYRGNGFNGAALHEAWTRRLQDFGITVNTETPMGKAWIESEMKELREKREEKERADAAAAAMIASAENDETEVDE